MSILADKVKQMLSFERFDTAGNQTEREKRTQFQRDYDKVVFSSAFRRLQNKTQVFPLPGAVFVHNRLTHSMEVSCVGRSLGNDCAYLLQEKYPELKNIPAFSQIGAIVSAGCLAHDLGNPPFGHFGEKAICSYFKEGAGAVLKKDVSVEQWADFTHFDGNANTFRLLTHHFEGKPASGFGLTYATLASIVKYPYPAIRAGEKPKFGYFEEDREAFEHVAEHLGLKRIHPDSAWYTRHPLVYLVEAADDICYQIMDIEDAFKLGILDYGTVVMLLTAFLSPKGDSCAFTDYLCSNNVTDLNSRVAYLRSKAISVLEAACADVFVEQFENIVLNGEENIFQPLHLVDHIPVFMKEAYDRCTKVARNKIYRNRDSLDVSLTGYRIITTLLDEYIKAIQKPDHVYSKLLINRASSQYNLTKGNLGNRIQGVLDFISGMTDVFALDLYKSINGDKLVG